MRMIAHHQTAVNMEMSHGYQNREPWGADLMLNPWAAPITLAVAALCAVTGWHAFIYLGKHVLRWVNRPYHSPWTQFLVFMAIAALASYLLGHSK